MARLTILMATFNGERFLKDQLDSFLCQTYSDWELWVSDDGSRDSTVSMLKEFSMKHNKHKIKIIDGPGKGFVQNFLSMSCSCQNESEFFAFADQDDIWQKGKLEKAVAWLETVPSDVPALYCTRTEIVDKDAKSSTPARYTPLMRLPPSFGNALVQSIAGGNTMVFNRAAKNLINKFGGAVPVPWHDWWMYLLVAGVGGNVRYDPFPSLKYRQHEQNVVGANRSLGALMKRFARFWGEQFKKYNELNLLYLQKHAGFLTIENQKKLHYFAKARAVRGLRAINYLEDAGICRNGVIFNIALKIGAAIGKI